MTAPWEETTLPTILARYELKDIFNADEFTVKVFALPCYNRQYHPNNKLEQQKKLKIEDCVDFVNETIGKSAKMRCSKNVRNLPRRYRSQKKSWMDGTLFKEWLRELDRKFTMQERKIVMVVDNCPSHPDVSELKSINLQFVPPNTTSCTQPMDQGVIRYVFFVYEFLSFLLYFSIVENICNGMSSVRLINSSRMF
ncbi:tigger transposable element-derived protein 4-like [Hydractinia symbiolongicarpus]|uniref:tigger transposable element-derived protein 4-like n=1 Tax=Hydractinia symbiolongicarpus TaxID=13093 RepID=UPI00254AA641|nr:tigger transposable element-derived protein 4-like [Hydractinia symbiolongicarpus]